jgi:PAS domain S-box-containing protein
MLANYWVLLAESLGVLGGALVGVGVLWSGLKKLKIELKKMFFNNDIALQLRTLTAQMKFVVDELQPNGGASVRDSLNRIELRQVLQEQRQKAIFSDMAVGVFETDVNGDFVWVNRKYLRMTGRTLEEVVGSGWINTVAQRDRGRVEKEWGDAVSEGREFESEHLIITPDDTRIEVSVRTYKMTSLDDSPLGFLGMLSPLCEKGRRL